MSTVWMRRAGAVSLLISSTAAAQDTSLVGLWHAKRWFGPEVRGELLLLRSGDRWQAHIGPRTADVRMARDSVSFDLPSGGTFKGRRIRNGGAIEGQWIQRRTAMPLTLTPCGTGGCYAGLIRPLEDDFTFYMEVKPRGDGKLGAFLRNPERNQGRFIRLDHLARRGDTVELRNAGDSTIERGVIRYGRLSVILRFATYDFQKVPPDSFTHFYPRGWRTGGTYAYAPPRATNDGWAVAKPEDVGLSREKLSAMVQTLVNSTVDSANAYRLHGILVARHGKLVLEEYFFGEHADKPHDTRSASKTVVTVVLGAAMQAGMKVGPETPVFATMGHTSATLDPRKRAMTIRHLLTMSAGLDCDDNSRESPGSENVLTNQDTNPDWLRMVLGLKMLRDPGAQAVYCSINPFLAGEVLAQATGRSFPALTWELVGAPLQMGRYYIGLTPLGNSYMGGGARYLPRDFMKLAQLYANGGTWNGRRILSEAWVRESVEPLYTIGRSAHKNYGYLWWTTEYQHLGRRILAHYASGNGGQVAVFIPELGLVIAAWGGNYNDPGGFVSVRELIPQHILPAIVR
jgi:CubicO group peptidase (beta-lactamase class C family)